MFASTETATSLPVPLHPDSLAHEGQRVVIGSKAQSLVALLIKNGRCASVENAKATVFGDAKANRGRLDTLVCRVNSKLAALGYSARLSVDGADVLLLV